MTDETWYSPFGEPTALAGALPLLGFQGQLTDSSTGTVDMTTRQYLPSLGRFTTRDVLGGDPANPPSLNQWVYATGNPITFTDPTGMRGGSGSPPCDPDCDHEPSTGSDDDSGASSGGDASDSPQPNPTPGPKPDETYIARQAICQLMQCSHGSLVNSTAIADFAQLVLAACGFVPVLGDLACDSTDAVISGLRGDEVGAAMDIAGLIPLLGWSSDSADTVRSADRFLDAIDVGRSGARLLPDVLRTGRNAENGVNVYLGIRNGSAVYAGITNDIARRAAQHGAGRFDDLLPLTRFTGPVTRGEARSIEEALIRRNVGVTAGWDPQIHSISPTQPYYGQALAWGEQWLVNNGF